MGIQLSPGMPMKVSPHNPPDADKPLPVEAHDYKLPDREADPHFQHFPLKVPQGARPVLIQLKFITRYDNIASTYAV